MRQTRNEENAERFKKQAALMLAELYPKAHYRLAFLKDGDEQLTALIDLFDSQGLPTGSNKWPTYCTAFVRRLLDEQRVLERLLAQNDNGETVDWERAEADLTHARRMHSKRKPKFGMECYYCGHNDATTILHGSAICEICKTEHPEWEKEMK